jgi:hypothetical protein
MAGTTVEVDINNEGDVRVHVLGAKGPSCKKQVDAFAGAFGKLKEEGRKPEYFKPEANRNIQGNNVRLG